jgi:hypothetical protein
MVRLPRTWLRYVGKTITNQNSIHEEIKSRLNSDNVCRNSVQNLFVCPSTIEKYKEILSVHLYGCETWSLTLRKEGTLRMFENMVLNRIFRHKSDELRRTGVTAK